MKTKINFFFDLYILNDNINKYDFDIKEKINVYTQKTLIKNKIHFFIIKYKKLKIKELFLVCSAIYEKVIRLI